MENGKYDAEETAMLARCKSIMLEDLKARSLAQDAVSDLRLDWTQTDGMIESFTYAVKLRGGGELRYTVKRDGSERLDSSDGMEA